MFKKETVVIINLPLKPLLKNNTQDSFRAPTQLIKTNQYNKHNVKLDRSIETVNRISISIKRCRHARRNHTNYRCNEYWCDHCSLESRRYINKQAIKFCSTMNNPSFATILLKFISTPNRRNWMKAICSSVNVIEENKIKGFWMPEISFKRDDPKNINPREYGLCQAKRYFLHIHGIVDLSILAKLKEIFPLRSQVRVEEIGKQLKYQGNSIQENIENVVGYSTKRIWSSCIEDVKIIEMNKDGFPIIITKEEM